MKSEDKVTMIDKQKAKEQEMARTKDKRAKESVPKLNNLDVSPRTMHT